MNPLPATETSSSFTVSWSGQDDAGGSGIATYDIYVSEDGNAFTPFLQGTTLTAKTFTGVIGHTYGFYSVATDNVGNRQTTPTAAQATTRIVQPDPNTAYVTALYHDVLNRMPDQGGLNGWVHALQAGFSRLHVAQWIWESVEHRGQEVDSYYHTYLHRAADPGGRASWIGAFESGMDETEVQFGFLASAEYQHAHPSTDAYITALYANVLGRQPDAQGLASWESVATLPFGRFIIALGFLGSTEEDLRIVDGFYANFLGRHADAGGEQGWVSGLQDGALTVSQVAEDFLGSPEYFGRVTA